MYTNFWEESEGAAWNVSGRWEIKDWFFSGFFSPPIVKGSVLARNFSKSVSGLQATQHEWASSCSICLGTIYLALRKRLLIVYFYNLNRLPGNKMITCCFLLLYMWKFLELLKISPFLSWLKWVTDWDLNFVNCFIKLVSGWANISRPLVVAGPCHCSCIEVLEMGSDQPCCDFLLFCGIELILPKPLAEYIQTVTQWRRSW